MGDVSWRAVEVATYFFVLAVFFRSAASGGFRQICRCVLHVTRMARHPVVAAA